MADQLNRGKCKKGRTSSPTAADNPRPPADNLALDHPDAPENAAASGCSVERLLGSVKWNSGLTSRRKEVHRIVEIVGNVLA